MATWLLDRLKDQPDPHFALTGSANWMRALAILTEPSVLTNQVIEAPLSNLQRRQPRPEKDTEGYAYLLMALHNLAALRQFNSGSSRGKYNTIRSAIVAWYYVIYDCSSAMVLAKSGDSAEEHRTTARLWHAQIAKPGLICEPFSLRLDTIVKKDAEHDVQTLRGGNQHDLTAKPSSIDEAKGAVISYLNGTADYERQRTKIRVRDSKAFKALGVANFRKSDARALRDAEFKKGLVNFPIQAFRYRGKANYRDSVYLSYGADWESTIEELSQDLEVVAKGYFRAAAALIRRCTQRGTWEKFVNDIGTNFKPELDSSILA